MSDCEFEAETPNTNFNDRFRNYQNLIQRSSPYVGLESRIRDAPGCAIRTKKCSVKTRAKITPIVKLRTEDEKELEVKKPSRVPLGLPEGVLHDRVKEKLGELIDKIVITRPFTHALDMGRWVDCFVKDYCIKIPKGKEKLTYVLVYCILMSCRLNGVFLDLHLISIDLDLPLKCIVSAIQDHVPPITSKDPLHINLVTAMIDPGRDSLMTEYVHTMKRVVGSFSSSELQGVSTEDEVSYEKNCRSVFNMLEADVSCDYERQFCVTPDKVYIYGIFDIIREKNKTVTERMICDYLSSKFMIPRVTVEKMKRLVVKCRATL